MYHSRELHKLEDRVGGDVDLHGVGDAVSVAENLMQVLGAQDVPKGGLSQQPVGSVRVGKFWHEQCAPGAVVSVLHVGDADGGVADSVVDHRVHRHRHAVLRQHLHTDTDTVPRQLIS